MIDLPTYLTFRDEEFKHFSNQILKNGYFLDELSLQKAVKDNKNRQLVTAATILLKKYGTHKSLDSLKPLINYPYDDVKTAAVLSIGSISGSYETPFYVWLLNNPKSRLHDYAMIVIKEVGDERALQAVADYAHKITAGKVKMNMYPPTHLFVIAYLEKYSYDNELIQLLKKLPDGP